MIERCLRGGKAGGGGWPPGRLRGRRVDGRRFPSINRKKIPNLLEHRFTTYTYMRDYTSGLRSVKSASPLCVSGGAVYVQKIKKKKGLRLA